MSSEGTLAVAAAVVALVQLWKWAGLKDTQAPFAVILLSGAGVLAWLISGASWPPARTDVWPIMTGWIAVTLSAAGTFGFTRAGASAVASLSTPPGGGAGSEPSVKSEDAPDGPLSVVLHGPSGHVAFLTSAAPIPGAEMTSADAIHVGGRSFDPDAPIMCDGCGEHLEHVAVNGGEWVAVSTPGGMF